jgi:Flp pilus assembly protein TadD
MLREQTPHAFAFWLGILIALGCAPVAAFDSDPAPPSASSDLEAGRKAIQARDWNAAVKSLAAAERREPRNADVHNLLGYSYRNSGKLDLALKHYARALQLDPRHLGAHEYVGEAYLMTNNLPKAEEHLAALAKLCVRTCREREDLERQIAEFRRRSAAAK